MFWPAMSPPAGGEGQGGFPWAMVQMFLFVLIFMWFFMIRPQRKKQKEHQAMLTELAKGDRVVTNSGMLGTVVGIHEKFVVLKVSDETKIEFLKSSIAGKVDEKGG